MFIHSRLHCTDWREKLVLHSLSGSNPAVLVVDEHPVEEIDSIRSNSCMVVHVHERLEWDSFCVRNEFHKLLWHVQAVLPHVILQVLSAHNIDDFDKLVVVVSSLEERICLEHEPGEGASDSPHVKGVVVFLVFNKEFWSLVIATCNSHVVLILWLVEIGKTPIDQAQVSVIMVNDDIERFYISMHNSMDVRVLQSFQYFVGVHPDVHIIEFARKNLGFLVRDVLEDEGRSFADWIAQYVNQSDNIRSAVESLENLDFAVLFLDADWFKNFDHALFVILQVASFKYLGVFTSSKLMITVVIIKSIPFEIEFLIVRETCWAVSADEFMWTSE